MNFETKAARVVEIDAKIMLLQPADPTFVAHRLIPLREKAWRRFRREWSAGCSSSDCAQFLTIITKGKP
jgi:hypothetical protein